MVGEVGPDTLQLTAAARFPNEPVRTRRRPALGRRRPGRPRDRRSRDGVRRRAARLDRRRHLGGRLRAAAARPAARAAVPLPRRAPQRGRSRARRRADRRRGAVPPQRPAVPALQHDLPARRRRRPRRGDRDPADPRPGGHRLAGNQVTERTNASTTGLLDVTTARVGHRADGAARPRRVAVPAPCVDPGDLRSDAAAPRRRPRRRGGACRRRSRSHDTASAVVGVPMQTDDAAYVSLGTWALAGLELDAPVLTEEARLAGFTNEGGVDGTIRFLSNVMGTWLLSETLRAWGETDLAGDAAGGRGVRRRACRSSTCRTHASSLPATWQTRIEAWCAEHGVAAPRGRVAVVRCIVESIAAAVATALDRASALAGTTHRRGARRRRWRPEHPALPGDRRPVRPPGARRTGRGHRPRQRAGAGPGRRRRRPDLADLRRWSPAPTTCARFEPAWLRGSPV